MALETLRAFVFSFRRFVFVLFCSFPWSVDGIVLVRVYCNFHLVYRFVVVSIFVFFVSIFVCWNISPPLAVDWLCRIVDLVRFARSRLLQSKHLYMVAEPVAVSMGLA